MLAFFVATDIIGLISYYCLETVAAMTIDPSWCDGEYVPAEPGQYLLLSYVFWLVGKRKWGKLADLYKMTLIYSQALTSAEVIKVAEGVVCLRVGLVAELSASCAKLALEHLSSSENELARLGQANGELYQLKELVQFRSVGEVTRLLQMIAEVMALEGDTFSADCSVKSKNLIKRLLGERDLVSESWPMELHRRACIGGALVSLVQNWEMELRSPPGRHCYDPAEPDPEIVTAMSHFWTERFNEIWNLISK